MLSRLNDVKGCKIQSKKLYLALEIIGNLDERKIDEGF
jgi:hypothetical protein